jgi:UDP-glucose 4-epimerase
MWSELYGLPTVCLRYFSVYGPRLGKNQPKTLLAIDQFLKDKKEGKPHIIIGNGKQTRDFVHVYDVAQANILAMKSKLVGSGEVINIGTGRNISITDLAKLIGGTKKHIPFDKSRPEDTLADISKAKKLLGWEPTIKLEDGISELKKFWKI